MTPLTTALALVVLLSGLATGTALAADASLPGDTLYPVDLAVEQARMRITTRTQARAHLSLQIADERAEELIALVEEGGVADEDSVNRLQLQLQNSLATIAQLEQQERTQLLTQLRDRTGQQAAELEALGLHEEAGLLLRTRERAQLGIDDPAGFELRARNGLGWPDEEPVETPEATLEPTDETILPDQTQHQTQEQTQQQTQQQTQDRDQLRDGSCEDGDVDCVPQGSGEQQQGPPPEQPGNQSQGGGSDSGSGSGGSGSGGGGKHGGGNS